MAADTPLVHTERRADGVAVVRLDHPKVNALSAELLRQLEAAAQALTDDPPGAVVVTGGDRLFAAGADITEFGGPDEARQVGGSFLRALKLIAEHARSAALFLSGASPQKNGVRVGTTVDQIAAAEIGQDTPLPSIELAIEDVSLSCGAGYGCAYFNTISWKTPTVPLPMENSPQVVFEKLFGDGGTAEQRLQRKREDRSILDSIRRQTSDLMRGLPASDRTRLDGYLDDIREIERRTSPPGRRSSRCRTASRSTDTSASRNP